MRRCDRLLLSRSPVVDQPERSLWSFVNNAYRGRWLDLLSRFAEITEPPALVVLSQVRELRELGRSDEPGSPGRAADSHIGWRATTRRGFGFARLGLFNPKNPVWYARVIKKFFRRLHSVEMMVSALASIASLPPRTSLPASAWQRAAGLLGAPARCTRNSSYFVDAEGSLSPFAAARLFRSALPRTSGQHLPLRVTH